MNNKGEVMKLNKILALTLSCMLLSQPLLITASATEMEVEAVQQDTEKIEIADEDESVVDKEEVTDEVLFEQLETPEEQAQEEEQVQQQGLEEQVEEEEQVQQQELEKSDAALEIEESATMTEVIEENASPVAIYTDTNGFQFYDSEMTLLCGYSGTSTSITIPSTTVEIKSRVFKGNTTITKVVIPDSVKDIAYEAFSGCTALTTVVIGNGVEGIGVNAFYGCKALENLTLGNSVESIGQEAFYDCVSLKALTLPSSLKIIGYQAFTYCTTLTSVTIPDSVTTLGYGAFYGCNKIKTAYIGKGVTSISAEVFRYCTLLESVTLPDGLTAIGYRAFQNCTSLTSVELPDTVSFIFTEAFSNCTSLKSVYVPSAVGLINTTTSSGTFSGSTNLVVKCYEGSYMHKMAVENSYAYELVDVNTVQNLTASAYGKNNVLLKYTFDANADGYLIYGKRGGDGAYTYIGMSFNDYYLDTKATDSIYNFYWVIPFRYDLTGKISGGNVVRYVYAKGICPAVTDLKASSKTTGVQLSWSSSRLSDGYLVYGIRNGGDYGYVGMTTGIGATTFTDTKASKLGWNYYWVFPFHYDSTGKMVVGETAAYTYGKPL